MDLIITNGFDIVNIEDINKLEKELSIVLPNDYKSFLLKNNGGRPDKEIFNTFKKNIESSIQYFYGITENKNYSIKENYLLKGKLPKDSLEIAIDNGGSTVFINLVTESVYFFEHETEKYYLISKTFKGFLEHLHTNTSIENDFDIAISTENIDYFKVQINKGILIDNIVNEFNQRVVVICALRNKLNLLKWFLENKAKIDMALFYACSRGNLEIVKYLLSVGANCNESDITQNNDTCFITACRNGYIDIAKLLIEKNVDIYAKDIHGNNAFDKVKWSSHLKMIKFLEDIYTK